MKEKNLLPLQPHHTRRIYLLNHLQIINNGQQFTLRGSKLRALFAWFVLHPQRPYTREQLADYLWPDAPPQRARRNLSDTLYRLRRILGDGWLDVKREKISLHPSHDLWVDVWAFEAGIQAWQHTETSDTAVLQETLALYHDDLLPDLYDDWILQRRLVLREKWLNGLAALGRAAEQQRSCPTAHSAWQKLAQEDPLREEAYRGQMRVLAATNRLPEALAVYKQLEKLLAAELNVTPTEASQTLARQLHSELTLTQKAANLPQNSLTHRPYVGRIPERSAILAAVEAAGTGYGSFLAIEGKSGIGKSSLLAEIAAGAKWRSLTVVRGYAVEQPGASPYTPLVEALAQALAPPRDIQLQTILPPETLAAAAALYEPWAQLATLPVLPPERTRERFHQAVCAVFQAIASLSPHLIILDDLHWADAALWDVLASLAANVSTSHLLVLLTYRRPGIEQTPGWPILTRWQESGRIRIFPLRPFTLAETTELLPSALRSEAETIHAASGGVPFYITEILIALAEGQAPYGQTVISRARTLPQEAWQALAAAAVIGQEIPYVLWAKVTHLPPVTLSQVGDKLCAHRLLRPIDAGYAFCHELIRQAIYDDLPLSQRQELHRQTAVSLAETPPQDLFTYAYHLDKAGDELAGEAYRQAGQLALQQHAYTAALHAFTRSVAFMPSPPTAVKVETLLALAEAAHITGEREQQETALSEARQAARSLGDAQLQMKALLASGKMAAKTGQHKTGRQWLTEALSLANKTHHPSMQLACELALGDLAIRQGDLAYALAHFETAVTLARQQQDTQQEGRALDGIGFALMNQGQDTEAISAFEQALSLQREAADPLGTARTLVNLLSAHQSCGAWDKVLSLADEAWAAQKAVSYRLGMGAARQAQGTAACMLGDFAAARQAVTQARHDFAAAQDEIGVGISTDVLGLIAQREEKYETAESHFREALAIAEKAQAATFATFARQDLGLLLVDAGHFDEAIPLLETAVTQWREQGDELNQYKCEAYLGLALAGIGKNTQAANLAAEGLAAWQKSIPSGEEPQIWLWALSRLLTQTGQQEAAQQTVAAAYAELQKQARATASNEMRRRFFACVPVNREIVAAYDRQTGQERQIMVTLARQDAPLGRPLGDDEVTAVRWTIYAPEDEAIQPKAERRRYRLSRLLAEAQAQNAAPTDDDLAQALGVSRRTILRDMAALQKEGVSLPTRRR